MGPDLEVLVSKEDIPAPAFSGPKVLERETIYSMEVSSAEQTPLSHGNEDVQVNITGTGCTNSGKALVVEDVSGDLSESSSSFGDTRSGAENGSAVSDTEVESRMFAGDASSPMCDDCCEIEQLQIRKKKVTTHWRSFIRPLMWRCKWIELQLKQLQYQALKYSEEIAALNYTKELDFAHLTLDGFGVKSVPISGRIHRNRVMKRNKRKRVEEKLDLASYMSNHSVFSYYDSKNCTFGACSEDFHGVSIGGNGDKKELKLNDILSSLNYEHEKPVVDIIQKIEAVHSQVHKLKTRIDKVVSENPGKFSSVTQLSMLGPSDGFNHSEGITPLIGTIDRPQLEVPWEDPKDAVLVQNQAATEELYVFENVGNQLVEKTKESVEEKKSISLAQFLEPDLATENAVHNVYSTLSSTLKSNFPRNKRRVRKSSSKSWSRKSSG